jgi:hypothetical protein
MVGFNVGWVPGSEASMTEMWEFGEAVVEVLASEVGVVR